MYRTSLPSKKNEVLFQIGVHILVFIFYAFDREQSTIPNYKYFNFLNYALTAAVINYVVLPRFYISKKAVQFTVTVLLSIFISALVEEFVLEKIFFTGRRAELIKMTHAFIDIIPVVGILVGLKFAWDATLKQREVDRLRKVVKESELQFLKSQINPHFLFNNLNNLYSYALEGSPKTPEIILELSGLLRYMLYECRQEFVSFNKELKQLRNFVSLNELQIEDRGIVNLDFGTSFGNYQIAPLILIVFVENAFKHSQNSLSEKITIDISIDVNDNGKLHFTCKNSYGAVDNDIDVDHGIGLENVKKRLNLIYPERHSLNIDNHNSTYEVDLYVDLQSN